MSCGCSPAPCAPLKFCEPENFGLQFPSLVGPMGPPGGPGLYVQNVEALRFLDATAYPANYVANVISHTAFGDGGGGVFYYDPSSALSDNDGTIIRPSNGVGRWFRIYDDDPNALWFGVDRTGATDSSVAVQNLVDTGAAALYFPSGIYRAKNVVLGNSVTIYGDGDGTVLKSVTVTIAGFRYSQNIFTATALPYVTLRDLQLDGDGTGIGAQVSAKTLIFLSAVTRVRLENVIITKYSGGDDMITPAIKDWLFYAVVIRYATTVDLVNVRLIDNNYEQILIYNAESSDCIMTCLGCKEINTGAPTHSHSAITTVGGHFRATNCFFKNVQFSTLSVQLPRSAVIAGCGFYDMTGLVGPFIDIGQGELGPNNNIAITDCSFKNGGAGAIFVAWANAVTISGCTIERPGQQGIKINAELNTPLFTQLFPDWSVPTLGNSYDITINDTSIFGVKNDGGSTGHGIKIIHRHATDFGFRVVDVCVDNCEISGDVAPYNTIFGIVLEGVQDAIFTKNFLNYGANAFLVTGPVERVRIVDGNTFASTQLTSGSDLLFNGDFSKQDIEISRNTFLNYPPAGASNVQDVGGWIVGLLMLDNMGLHPRGAFQAGTVNLPVIRSTRNQLVTAPPASGIWAENDVAVRYLLAGGPEKYFCSNMGSFVVQTGKATGVAGNFFFTASIPGEIGKGTVLKITGAGPAAADLTVAVISISGSTVQIDTVISTSVVAANLTVINPTFVKTANLI